MASNWRNHTTDFTKRPLKYGIDWDHRGPPRGFKRQQSQDPTNVWVIKLPSRDGDRRIDDLTRNGWTIVSSSCIGEVVYVRLERKSRQ